MRGLREWRDKLEMIRMLWSGKLRLMKVLDRMKTNLSNPRIRGLS